MKPNDFMTTKEKDYVADVFLKNIKYSCSGLYYSVLFNKQTEKLPFPFSVSEEKKNSYVSFGKEVKKSFKFPQYHSGVDLMNLPCDLQMKYRLEQTIYNLICYNYYKLECDDTTIKDALELVNLEIEAFVKLDKFFILLDYLVKLITPQDVKLIYIFLINNYESLENPLVLNTFLNNNLEYLPCVTYSEIQKSFVEGFMYKSSGILLATSLLINNNELSTYFYYHIVVNDTSYLDNNYIWMFLAVLISFVDDDKKFKLVELTRNKIFELKRTSDVKFDSTKYFLKAIGLSKEDVIN